MTYEKGVELLNDMRHVSDETNKALARGPQMTVRAHADGVNATASWREIAVGVIGITVTLLAFIGGTHLTAPYHEGMTQFVEDKLDPLQSQGIETATLLLSMQTQLTRIEAKLTEQDKNITGFYRDYGAGLSWSQRQAEGVER